MISESDKAKQIKDLYYLVTEGKLFDFDGKPFVPIVGLEEEIVELIHTRDDHVKLMVPYIKKGVINSKILVNYLTQNEFGEEFLF